MSDSWTRRQFFPIFSLACLELVWRSIVELAGAANVNLIPVGGLVISRELLNATALGQFLGLLLLGTATFQTFPEVFPDHYLDWGNDVAARILVAGGVVAAALQLNGLVAQLPYLEGGSFAPIPTMVTLLGISSIAGLLTAVYQYRGVPQIRPFPQYVRYRYPQDGVTPVLPPIGILVSRVLLILVFGGLSLAVVSRLYPLPELLFVGVTVYEGLSEPTMVRTDIAEAFIAGLRSIWAGIQGVLGVSYGIGGLLFVVWLDVAYIAGLENRAEVFSDPVTLLFALVTVGLGTVHATTALVRLIERLPDDVTTDPMVTVDKPLIPGLLLPSAALFGWYVRTSTIQGNAYSLSATVPDLSIAVVLGVVAVIPLVRPSWGPSLPVSDYVTVALAPSLFFASWGASSLAFGSDSTMNPFVVLYALAILSFSPFLGYELFRLDRYESFGDWFSGVLDKTFVGRFGAPGDRLFVLLSEVVFATIVFVVGIGIGLTLEQMAWSSASGNILGAIGATFVLPPLTAILFRSLLIPFYIPEQLTNQFN